MITFIFAVAYVFGLIGGIGYALKSGANAIAVGVAALGAMAFPYIKGRVKKSRETIREIRNL